MYEFIQVVCEKVPEPEWWPLFYEEYNELTASSKQPGENKSLDLAIQINYIRTRITIVQTIVERLWVRRNDEAIELLIEMGFGLSFENLRPDLERVILMLKGEEIDLNRAVAEYGELEKKAETGKSTELIWYNVLAMLGKHNNYQINPRIITVMEYIALDSQFRAWVKMNSPKNVE